MEESGEDSAPHCKWVLMLFQETFKMQNSAAFMKKHLKIRSVDI